MHSDNTNWCVGRGLALRVHFNHVKVGLDSRAFYTGLGTVDANDCERSYHGVEFHVADRDAARALERGRG